MSIPASARSRAYRNASFEVLWIFKNPDGTPFADLMSYTHKMIIADEQTGRVKLEVDLDNTEEDRLAYFFTPAQINELPQDCVFDVLSTSKTNPNKVVPLVADRLSIFNRQNPRHMQSLGTFTLSDIQNVVEVHFGTIPLKGADGVGVPEGGTTGQVLSKASNDNFDTEWADSDGGGNGNGGDGGGNNGWSPVLAVISDDERRVLQVIDWIGGQGTKPDSGDYVSEGGFVEDISEAANIRGSGGDPGVGISGIALHATAGLVKTYRITFTNSTTFDFDVTDGEDGQDGAPGQDGATGATGNIDDASLYAEKATPIAADKIWGVDSEASDATKLFPASAFLGGGGDAESDFLKWRVHEFLTWAFSTQQDTTVTGTGFIGVQTSELRIRSGTTAESTAVWNPRQTSGKDIGVGGTEIDWGKDKLLSLVTNVAALTTNGSMYGYIGKNRINITSEDASSLAVGFAIKGTRLYLHSHNGTTLDEIDTMVDISVGIHLFQVYYTAGENVKLYHNKTLVATSTHLPTGTLANASSVSLALDNGTDAAQHQWNAYYIGYLTEY